MVLKTSVKLDGDWGMQSPGGNWFMTKSPKSLVLTPFLNSLLHTLVWKAANLAVMACRFSCAKTTALLCSWVVAAVDKNREQNFTAVAMTTLGHYEYLKLAIGRYEYCFTNKNLHHIWSKIVAKSVGDSLAWGSHFCSRGKGADQEQAMMDVNCKNYAFGILWMWVKFTVGSILGSSCFLELSKILTAISVLYNWYISVQMYRCACAISM